MQYSLHNDFIQYGRLIRWWNQSHNIMSKNDLSHIFFRHIANSLCLYPYIAQAKQVIDVGTGAGFPGIPLALLSRYISQNPPKFLLVDKNPKKISFLTEVIGELNLHHDKSQVELYLGSLESLQPQSGVHVVSRALAPLPKLLSLLPYVMGAKSHAYFLKGRHIDNEIQQLSPKQKKQIQVYPLINTTIVHVKNIE